MLDIKINSFGVKVDTELVAGALAVNDETVQELTEEAKKLQDLKIQTVQFNY